MGKLNILHHKDWHVYKRDNRLRVQKDEEEARILQEEALQKKLKDERDSRLESLKISRGETQAFTLFPVQNVQKEKISCQDVKNDPWVMKLGETKTGEKAQPWYSKGKNQDSASTKDDLKKFIQDPLRQIKSTETSSVRIEKKASNSIEELRRKRLEREKQESLKAMELLTGKKSNCSKDYKLHEREQDYYHSQFNREALENVKRGKQQKFEKIKK